MSDDKDRVQAVDDAFRDLIAAVEAGEQRLDSCVAVQRGELDEDCEPFIDGLAGAWDAIDPIRRKLLEAIEAGKKLEH